MKTFYALTVDGDIENIGEYNSIDEAIEKNPEDIVWYFDKDSGLELINDIAKELNDKKNPCLMTHHENEQVKKAMKHENYMSLLSGLSFLSILRNDPEAAKWYEDMYLEYKKENTPPKDDEQ